MVEILDKAKGFHGHLGPYLVIGFKMGDYAIRKLKAHKYFGLEVRVEGKPEPPQSCIIDGLQLATGCTMGKQNIKMVPASNLKVLFTNLATGEQLSLNLLEDFARKLDKWLKEKELEEIAKEIYRMPEAEIFGEV